MSLHLNVLSYTDHLQKVIMMVTQPFVMFFFNVIVGTSGGHFCGERRLLRRGASLIEAMTYLENVSSCWCKGKG